ncbi:MAG: leucine--tRNA ligase [Armatimonadetes bacterium]|nr:leucine--tRNA ligase [Armatimonadota bacterium]
MSVVSRPPGVEAEIGAQRDRSRPQEIEAKWHRRWEKADLNRVTEDPAQPKYYALTMYPYPSGDVHIGHWYAYAPPDARARFMRMRGYNVLFPMGFDAFGLPAENAAIRRGIHPAKWTYENIRTMERQLRSMGAMIDWSREIITADPEYYRWNQWFFLKFYERGLAYRTYAAVDWCPRCNTTLAREQVIGEGRVCERCETSVIKRELNQWFLKITDYAEELLDFSELDWPEKIITLQRNWIGRSEGVEFEWQVAGTEHSFRVFTTRPDTVYGATFCVLAPEHPLVSQITTPDRREEVERYVYQASRETEIERLSAERERTGVFIGAYAINPMNQEKAPIYIADYVLMTYGTGAIMAVPAHDERDFDFARRYGLPIPVVIVPPDWDGVPLTAAYTGEGIMANSGPFDGMPSRAAWDAIADEMAARGIGQRTVNYRLRDWLISRQRYWGTPIPILYCEKCGIVLVPEDQLPVTLPEDVEFIPTGESPLKFHERFRKTTCPQCGGPAERETDTMDTFVDSSWYQYRYLSPHYAQGPFDPEKGAYWLPVDIYTGGAEHAVMHLLYARFFHKVMRDMGLVSFNEPYPRLFNQGTITAFTFRKPSGEWFPASEVEWRGDTAVDPRTGQPLHVTVEKMSKSKLNVTDPDNLVERHGADAVRLFLMFIGPWDQGGPWDARGFEGVVRFLNRVWTVVTDPQPASGSPSETEERELRRAVHRTIKKVTGDLERFAFNTMVAALMEFVNALMKARGTALAGSGTYREATRALTLMLAPGAPHLAEELWERLGQPFSVHQQAWPTWDEALAAPAEIEIAVQVNGKVRDRITVAVDAPEAEVTAAALASERVQAQLQGRPPRKVIYVPGRLVNIVG